MKHEKHEINRKIKNIRMEMKSLDHRLKRLPKTHPEKEHRKREEKTIKQRMDELEEKYRGLTS